MVMIIGVALVLTGVIQLPTLQTVVSPPAVTAALTSAPPVATEPPEETVASSSPTPKPSTSPTPRLTPTNTPEPAESVSVSIFGVGEYVVPAGTPVLLTSRWVANTSEQVIDYVRGIPNAREFKTSYVPMEGGPAPFYYKLGFVETGEMLEGEKVLVLNLE